MKISISCDHGGRELKSHIIETLSTADLSFKNMVLVVDAPYPIHAQHVCHAVLKGHVDYGLLICGSGIGMAMAANRLNGIRAVCASSQLEARLAREHNDANVLCLGERLITPMHASEIISTFIKTDFEGGRHINRVKIIDVVNCLSPLN